VEQNAHWKVNAWMSARLVAPQPGMSVDLMAAAGVVDIAVGLVSARKANVYH